MTTSKNLFKTPLEREQRNADKRRRVLRFLRQEIWSSQEILGATMGLASRTAAHKNLQRMEAEGLVRRHQVIGLGGGSLTLWGITPHGQGMAFELGTEEPITTHFEPHRVTEQTIRHDLDLQRIRVRAEQAGWSDWVNGDRLGNILKGDKRPDALIKTPSGQKVALEVERTIKTKKRYQAILAAYLMALKAREVDRVQWLCPTTELALRLKAILLGIVEVSISGQRFAVDPSRHHCNLHFASYMDWHPENLWKEPSA